MNKSIDELLKDKLVSSKYNIPESFERKLNKTIKEIEDCEVRNSSKRVSWLLANKVASVAILVLMLSVVSISSYAAVNMFQDRMATMPEKVKENYNNDVQKSNVEADAYSRKLTDSEEEKIISLSKQYEKEGKFPQKEIQQVKSNENIIEQELYFVTEESKFYLPERTLTEEEMLQIIDLQEKRDYSVRRKNREGDPSGNGVSQPNAELEKQSVLVVAKLYNLTENNLEIVSTNIEDACYEVVVKEGDVRFSVYYSEENVVERVVCKKDNLSAHESGVKIKRLKTKTISKKMKESVKAFTGKEIKEQSSYSLVDDKEQLVYGTISYYYQMSDGSGCVAVYSTAYDDLYDIYTIDNAAMIQEIREKEKKAGEGGYTYQQIK